MPGHVGKADALGGGDVDLGVAPAQAEGHGALAAAGLLHELFAHVLAQPDKDEDGQDKGEQEAPDGGDGLLDHPGKIRPGVVEPLGEGGVLHGGRLIDHGPVLVRKQDPGVLHLYRADVLLVDHVHEGAVVHLRHLLPGEERGDQGVEQQNDQQNDAVVVEEGFLGRLDFFHGALFSPSRPARRASMGTGAGGPPGGSAYQIPIISYCNDGRADCNIHNSRRV